MSVTVALSGAAAAAVDRILPRLIADRVASGITTLDATLPVVFGGRPLNPEGQSYYVDVDNAAAAAKGTQFLIDQGRQRIATITGSPDMPAGIDREVGWRRAMEGAGLRADLVANGDFSMASGARCMRALLDRAPGLDAVFVASDLMATGAVSVLRERGRAIPTDVAVVGFDDSFAATNEPPGLTTVRQAADQMGWAMADMLLELLADRTPQSRTRILPTTLVLRETA